MYRIYLSFLLLIFICACGYKPMAYFANNALGNSVYVELTTNLENTEESVKIKDMVNEAIASRFHLRVANKKDADSILEVAVKNVQDTIIATNSQGFVTFYRVFVYLTFKFSHNGKTYRFENQGYYDYPVSLTSPTITYNNRVAAILEASKQSIDRFVSQVGYSATF